MYLLQSISKLRGSGRIHTLKFQYIRATVTTVTTVTTVATVTAVATITAVTTVTTVTAVTRVTATRLKSCQL